MNRKPYNVLFLCTGNSARSILAEGILNALGNGRFHAYSAGSFPKGRVNPLAVETLRNAGHDVSGLRSKSWDEFAGPEAPHMDFVFTVCDAAAGEACPLWPGRPVSAHWGFADPSHVEGDEATKRTAFANTYREIEQRIKQFLNLSIDRLDYTTLQAALREMGKS